MYPLALEPILKPKPWGGARWPAAPGTGEPIGESWVVADLGDDVTPGGARSVVANGRLAGATLRDAMREWGDALRGVAAPTAGGDFPLLVKLIDAREPLSVQVHPDAGYVASHPGTHHKTESWYVVDAEPGAVLWIGLRDGVGEPELLAAFESGDIAGALARRPAVPGTVHHLPAGTVHALGAGVVVAEVQTPSDTTFRLYDWQHELIRAPRRLHVAEALAAIHWGESPPPPVADGGPAPLLTTAAYAIRRLDVAGATSLDPEPASCRVVLAIAGEANVAGTFLAPDAAVVVPAALAAAGASVEGTATLLEIVPA